MPLPISNHPRMLICMFISCSVLFGVGAGGVDDTLATVTCCPHLLQNRACGSTGLPHCVQNITHPLFCRRIAPFRVLIVNCGPSRPTSPWIIRSCLARSIVIPSKSESTSPLAVRASILKLEFEGSSRVTFAYRDSIETFFCGGLSNDSRRSPFRLVTVTAPLGSLIVTF